jgi:hypothetical protein
MLKKLLKVLVLIIALVVLGVGGFLGWVQLDGIPKYAPGRIELKVEVRPERIARGKPFVSMLCAVTWVGSSITSTAACRATQQTALGSPTCAPT